MTLSKQHFIKIADILRYNKDKPFNDLINEFIIYFESQNANFDKSRFLDYLNK